MADDDSIESSDVTVEPRQESQYKARVIIVVNRTGRRGDSCKKYSTLPVSVLAVAEELRNFFESLNMYIHYEENVDQTAIREIVSKVIEDRSSYGDDEKIVFYYIGHGEKGELLPYCTCDTCRIKARIEDDVRDSDGEPQKIIDLIKMFHNETTTDLRKLPVLFFFDCCQGEDFNEGLKIKNRSMGSPPPEILYGQIVRYVDRIPDAGNILIAHSTLPMLKAYCHPVYGPLWTRILLANLKIDQSIGDALHATQREVSTIDNSITDLDDNIILHRTQPSMFYSSLHCEPINFYAMGANLRTAISTTTDPDSGYPEESDSEAVGGNGSEPSQTAASLHKPSSLQESESDPSKSIMYPGSSNPIQHLKALRKDVKDKTQKVSELEECITQLKQEAERREEEYVVQLANKEKEMNDLREKLEQKEKELEETKTKAQHSERQNLIVNEQLKKELEMVKKEHEDTINELNLLKDRKDLEIALLKLEHSEKTSELRLKISNQETELERKNKEIAQEQVIIAKLNAEISRAKADNAMKERDVAIKKVDKYKRKIDKVVREREEGNEDQMNKAQKRRPSSSSVTEGMENMKLNSNTEAVESDDNPSTS